jgi:uncharacterized protein YndB with AHSA1/START domain
MSAAARTIQPAPIRHSVTVKASPERAFAIFATRIGAWWPKGKTPGSPHTTITIEPHAGGRWFHIAEDGSEHDWGVVLDYAPPRRLLLGWKLNAKFVFDPDFLTEVEVTFQAQDNGLTRVTLEHRNLERFAEAAEKTRASLDGGWPGFLKNFADFVDADEDES